MIEVADIIGPYQGMTEHYIYIEFSDGSHVSLDEEELKKAAELAEKGYLHD